MTSSGSHGAPASPLLLIARLASPGDEMVEQGSDVSGKTPPSGDTIFALVAFTSIALYNVMELTCIIATTFKKQRGLYFISFCVATWGIPPYSIGFLLLALQDPQSKSVYGCVTLIVVGWACMVTGQSVVLYSRLHLIDQDERHLRAVLAMIIVNGVVLHTVTAIMTFGANSLNNPSRFYRPYDITEKVQVAIFFVQEIIISLLYIWATVSYFRNSALHTASTRAGILRHLILVNVLVIILDITILVLEYADLYKLQTSYKAMAYSVKLKLEFRILNVLVRASREHAPGLSISDGDYSLDGSRRGTDRSTQPTTPSGVSTGATGDESRSDGGRKKGGLKAAARYFTCSCRAVVGDAPPVGQEVTVRMTDMSAVRHEASEEPVGPLGETDVEGDAWNRDPMRINERDRG